MTKSTNWLVAVAVIALGLTVAAGAPDKPAKKPEKPADRRGEVVKVDGTKLVISKDAKETTIETNEKTVVVVDGQTIKLSELKPGQKVRVTPETGTAEKIEVRVAKKAAK